MSWHKIRWSVFDGAQHQGDQVLAMVVQIHNDLNCPQGFALFSGYEVEPDNSTYLTYYLSPVAATHCAITLEPLGLTPCDAPDPSAISAFGFLYGDKSQLTG